MAEDYRPPQKPLSRHMFGTLKYIATHKVQLSYLRWAHANTLGSLAQRGYLSRTGNEDDALIQLTRLGEEALREYTHGSVAERKHEGDLTERCMRLLRLARLSRIGKVA